MKHDVAASVVVYTGEVARAAGTGVGTAWTDLGAALIADNDWLQAVRVLRYAVFVGGPGRIACHRPGRGLCRSR